jgi:hypothetical protein
MNQKKLPLYILIKYIILILNSSLFKNKSNWEEATPFNSNNNKIPTLTTKTSKMLTKTHKLKITLFL